jgi:two-component system sensor histidine kinase RegB
MLGAFAVACATVLVFAHYPLPWDSDDPLQLPPIYMIGTTVEHCANTIDL